MGASPSIKVFDSEGKYIAACHYYEDAAAIIAARDSGQIRWSHSPKHILWNENHETQKAAESYDHVAEVCCERAKAFRLGILPQGGHHE